jgi:hypothetical protein
MNKTLLHKKLQDKHFKWFKKMLIENGAPKTIKEIAVRNSCGFFDSERSFIAGWLEHELGTH